MSTWTKIRGYVGLAAAAVASYYTAGATSGLMKTAVERIAKDKAGAASSDADAQPGGFYGEANWDPGYTPQDVVIPGKTSASDWSKYAGPAASLVGAGLNIYGQQQANQSNAQQAAINREYQERLSNTSYQRGTADMAAAGLNPMLAYSQGGASTPGGAQAQAANELSGGVSAALQASQILTGMDNTVAQTKKTEADTEYVNAQTVLSELQAQHIEEQIPHTIASAKEIAARIDNLKAQLPGIKSVSEREAIETEIRVLEKSSAKRQSEWTESAVGKNAPLIELILRGLGSGASAYSSVRR